MEIVKINSSRGYLSAVISYPKIETEKLAILCPGYLDSKDYKHLAGLAEALSSEYATVRFDPAGTWDSEGNISEYTTTQYLDDIKSVLEYMLEKNNHKRILLGGHSRGGMVSLLYAAKDSRISVVLGIMPSPGGIDKGEVYEKWKEIGFRVSSRDLPNDTTQKREYTVPYSHVEDKEKYNVIKIVKDIKVPIILFAGELDDLVSPEDVKNIFNNANEPKKFIIIPGIGHDYRFKSEEIKLVNQKVLEQLGQLE